MNSKGLEILRRTGDNQYHERLNLLTSIDRVESDNGHTLRDELVLIKKVLESVALQSVTSYTVDSDLVERVTINNPNYVYATSDLDLFYNGGILIKDYHYRIVAPNIVEFIDFTLSMDDEIVFKVYNKNKINIDVSYNDYPQSKVEAINDLNTSINKYISYVNKFKVNIVEALNAMAVDVSINDSLEIIASKVIENLRQGYVIDNDLGYLFGDINHIYNISYDIGYLFGEELDVQYFINGNDFGSIF